MAQEDVFKKLVSHCKEYGFVFPSSEIYDGLGAVYDYGQYGVELKNNIKKYWWDSMTLLHENVVGIDSAIFAVAAVVAIITMHDAMGVRRETGEQAKVLNKMLEQWIEVTEKNNPFLQNMHLKEMVGHTPLQVMAGFALGILVGFLYPMGL